MADNNDTGTGGINLNGDLYTVDVVEPNSPDEAAGGKQGSWSPGKINVDKTVKDISRPTRETFAKYLSNATLGKPGSAVDLPARPNPYPVGAGDGTSLQDTKLKDNYGNPLPPGISPNESKFAPEFNQTIGAPAPLPLKRGYTIDPPADASASAGGQPVAVDGNGLLRNAATPADPDPYNYVKSAKGLSSPLNDYVSSVLKNNRFNPVVDNKSFIPDYLSSVSVSPATNEQYESNASFTRPDQLRFGASPGNDDITKREYGFKRLARIAPILQQNATFLGRNTSNQSSNNSTSAAQSGNLDSGTDLSLPVERINVESIIREMSTELVKPEEITNFGSRFETILNNLVDRFSGLNTESQIAVASALVTAVFKSYEVVDGQIGNAYLPAGRTKRYGNGGGRQGIGTYYGGPTEPTSLVDFIKVMSDQNMAAKKLQFLNVRPTSRPFREAVMRGMQEFFNLEPGQAGEPPSNRIKRPTKNTSHSIVFARSIIRAATRMALLLKEINDAPGLSGEEKTYESVKVIRDSRLMGIFNFFAHLGDVGLDNSPNALPLYDVSIADLDAGRKISMIDSFSDDYNPKEKNTFSAKHGKSRLFGGKVRKLAWAMNQTPDYLFGPSPEDMALRNTFSAASGMISKDPTSKMRQETLPDIGRFPTELRSGIETLYESEYVPFYFHDLRTNEILGFHAFILSLSEDYAASYESMEGYGRVEPVKIYKGTQRKISLSFLAAALDYNDFDTLWYKINKLTTLVYPQFTPGKILSDAEGQFRFTKPFTQAIGASPMIRIRLGNLLRSNYSKYNLAKIFGLDQPDAVILGQDKTGQIVAEQRKQKALQNIADAKGKAADANKRYEAALNDYYNNQYKYAPDDTAGDIAVLALSKADQSANSDDKGKVKDAVNAAQNKNAADAWKLAEATNKKQDVPPLDDPFFNYGLVCRVQAVQESSTAPTGKEPAKFNFAPVDPTKSYSPDTIFRVSFEKMTQDDFFAETLGPEAREAFQKNSPEDQDAIQKNKKITSDALKSKQDQYDNDVKSGKAPDITKYEFSITQRYLDPQVNMIAASRDQFEKNVNKLAADADAADQAAQSAADQQAIDDAAYEEEQKKVLAETGDDPKSAATKKFLDKAQTFMNSENNSIVRSFRSTGGRGLAGFIETMAFDWMAGTWDTSDGRKAPKMCKVTISFSPVHDITPGLDAWGQNRAPIYPNSNSGS